MRQKAKLTKARKQKNKAKVSVQNDSETIKECTNDTAKEHVERRNKILETLQQVQTYEVNKSFCDSDCTYFSITHVEEEIYSPVLEDFLTELNIIKPEKESLSKQSDSFPIICSYCRHISTISKNLIKPINNTTLSPLAKCKTDLSFLQAIVWLKTVAARMHGIPADEYNSIFNVFIKAPECNISKCQKEIVETNFTIVNKQFNDNDSLNIKCNTSKYDSKEQNLEKLNKENRNRMKRNNTNESLLDNSPLTPQRWNNAWTKNECVFQNILIPESDEELMINSEDDEHILENISINYNGSNLSFKRDSAYETMDVDQLSIDLFQSINEKNQNECLQKKRKVEIEDILEKRKKCIKENISTEWVNFTLKTLDTDSVVIESVKIILTIFKDVNIIKDYLKRKNWIDTLEKEAFDAILNISHIFRVESKSDICTKEIIQTIKDILEEICQVTDLNKVTLQIYHTSIILELCNPPYICNKVIDFLMAKLQHFSVILTNIVTNNLNGLHNIINKVHLVLHALSICLQKYMINIGNNENSSKQDVIPAVINLWRKQWNIDPVSNEKIKEQENIESWANSLEAFTMAYLDDLPLLAEKARQLYRILIVQ